MPLRSAALLIYFPSILMSLGQGMIIPALPALGDTFGVSGAVAVQAVTAQLIGRTLVLIPAGAVVDRWGTKLPMVGGASLAVLSGLSAAAAPNFIVVLLAQFTWGAGTSVWMLGREIAAFDMVQADQRGRQMSALMGIGSTGMAFGPAIGGILTDTIGVRSLFLVYAGTSTVVLALSVISRNVVSAHAQRGGGLLNWGAFKEIHPYFRMTYAILFFSTFVQFIRNQVTNTMLPLYTQEELSYSATTSGLLFTVIGAITFLMIVPTGFISDKLGRKWAATPAAAFSFVAFILFPTVDSIPGLLVAAFVIGIANGLAMGAMTIYTYDIVPDHVRGQLQAMRRAFGELGAVISPPVSGVLAAAYGPGSAFWAFAPLHAASAILLFFGAKESLGRRQPPGAPGGPDSDPGASRPGARR